MPLVGMTLRHHSPIHSFTDFQKLYQSNHGTAGNREAGGFVNSAVKTLKTFTIFRYNYTESSIQTRNLPEFPFITICNMQGINIEYTREQAHNKSSLYSRRYKPMVKGVKELLLGNKSNYTESETDLIVDEILKLRTLYANLGTDADNYGYQHVIHLVAIDTYQSVHN